MGTLTLLRAPSVYNLKLSILWRKQRISIHDMPVHCVNSISIALLLLICWFFTCTELSLKFCFRWLIFLFLIYTKCYVYFNISPTNSFVFHDVKPLHISISCILLWLHLNRSVCRSSNVRFVPTAAGNKEKNKQ